MAAFWYRLSRGKRIVLLLVLLILVGLAAGWLARGVVSEKERVKGAVLEAIEAAEDQSVKELAPTISREYRGFYGTNYEDLMARAARDFTLITDLRIHPSKWTIQIKQDRATVDLLFSFHLIYKRLGPYTNVPIDELPSTPRGQDNKARLTLDREDGKWRITEIEVDIPEH